MRRTGGVALLLMLLPYATAQQVTITIGIPYCSTNTGPFSYGSMTSSSARSLPSSSSLIPGSSSSPGESISSLGSQSPTAQSSGAQSSGALPYTETSSTPSFSLTITPTSYSTPSPSASAYVDQYGEVYTVQSNMGLAGNTIDAAPVYGNGMRKRQEVGTAEQTFEDCVANCTLTPACVAVATMGTTCQLFSSVSGTMGLVGGTVAFNQDRFGGFSNGTLPASSMAASSSVGAVSSAAGTTSVASSAASIASSSAAASMSQSIRPSSSAPGSAYTAGSSTTSSWQVTTTTLTASGTPSWWSEPPSTLSQSFFTPASSSIDQLPSSLVPSSVDQVSSTSSRGQSTAVSMTASSFGSSAAVPPSSVNPSTIQTPVSSSVALSMSPAVSSSSIMSSMAFSTVIVTPVPSSEVPTSSLASSEAMSSVPSIGTSSSSIPVGMSSSAAAGVSSSVAVGMSSSTAAGMSSSTAVAMSSSMPLPSSSLAESGSATSSVASTPTWRPAITCPEQNGTTITDVNGIQYYLMCESDMGGDVVTNYQAMTSFNDCFNYCDAADGCTGFTYQGVEDGEGAGNCYLKSGMVYFVASDVSHVAAIRMSPFVSTSASASGSMASSTISGTSASVAVSSSMTSSMAMSSSRAMMSSGVGVSITPYPASSSSSSGMMASSSAMSIVSASLSSLSSFASSWSSSSSSASSSMASASSSSSSLAPYPTTTTSTTTTTRTTTTSTTTPRTTSTTTTTTTTSSTSSSSSRTSSSSSTSVASTPTPVVNSGKRGLAYTNASLTLPFSLSGQNSLVSWGYNWYNQRYTDTANTSNPAIRFIPLLFNDDAQLVSEWPSRAQAAINDGADALMSFNEPDLCGDGTGAACMSINRCVVAYQNYMMPFYGTPGVRIGAPAVTDNGGLQWLQQFMGNCTGCQYDFINLHWYSNAYAFSYLQYYVQLAYSMFGMPIWITEFGMDGETSLNTDAQTQTFIQQAVSFLDAVPYVERYSWFYDGPGYLINANGSGLSAQGVIYNSYTAPCANWTNSDGHC